MSSATQVANAEDVVAWLRAHPALKQPLQFPERRLTTRLAALDTLLGGGLPRGAITEIVGAPSSGRTALVLSAMGGVTAAEAVAWIDAEDALDVRSLTA